MTDTEAPGAKPLAHVGLDAVRFAAALVVMVGHTVMLSRVEVTGMSGDWRALSPIGTGEKLSLGTIAVVVFFVLSGYLVGGPAYGRIREGTFRPKDYALQRLTRLLTVLVPALVIGVIIDRLGFNYFRWGSLFECAHHVPSLISQFFGNLLFLQTSQVGTLGSNWALWSLAYEFWYYVLFPLVWVAATPSYRPAVRLLCAGIALAIVPLIGVRMVLYGALWAVGWGVAVLPKSEPTRTQLGASLALFVGSMVVAKLIDAPQLVTGLMVALGFGVALHRWVALTATVRSTRLSQWIERGAAMSYTLYLFHLPFLCLLLSLWRTPWKPVPLGTHIPELALFAVLTLGYSWLMYHLFESRTGSIRRWLRGKTGG